MRGMFVPKGWVLLTVAVDRLAEARRTAGQTNDDGRNAARAELRGELYRGSMLATIVHPGSGETHTIFPERWALEKALTWLEQGECLLTSGLVYPRLGISFNNDPTVPIFVSEHDLQRLMAKQEVKQEVGPPPDPSSRGKPTSEADSSKKISPIEVATQFGGKRPRGRQKGQGSFESLDLPLLQEMKRLISSGAAASAEEAARSVAPKAHGGGSLESKAERLARRFRSRAD
jgi:hypothetical protein